MYYVYQITGAWLSLLHPHSWVAAFGYSCSSLDAITPIMSAVATAAR